MSNGNGHHWSKFSWRDWSADKALHPCSLAAKGFWIEMLCIMHEGTPVGHLTLNGKPATVRQMAANAACTEREAERCLAELLDAGVCSKNENGVIFCRRMVKDAAASDVGRNHAEKRWNPQKSSPPPNGSPNGEATGSPNGEPYGDPNAKSLESESEVRVPPKPPRDRGGRRREEKPRYRNGFIQLIEDEGFPSLQQADPEMSQTEALYAIAGGRRGTG